MKILELFCGTKSFSNVAEKRGHSCVTVDNNPEFKPTLVRDIGSLLINDGSPDIIWASPPCQCFSIASIGANWLPNYIPKNLNTIIALGLLESTIKIIDQLNPKFFFIENPRGMMRKMPIMQDLHRKTVTYCRYGDTRMKPTDIWTNAIDWQPRPMCKNGDSCHVSAPRGSRTGTQGLKNATERGRVPRELCLEIIKYCEENI